MEQLILHLIGDYITQSHWMASRKTEHSLPAICHATVYSIPFLLITNWYIMVLIGLSHFLIDRFRITKYICKYKNYIAPPSTWIPLEEINKNTGYPNSLPIYISFWLLILADNTLHLLTNFLLIKIL